jgi:hypothetical protein
MPTHSIVQANPAAHCIALARESERFSPYAAACPGNATIFAARFFSILSFTALTPPA